MIKISLATLIGVMFVVSQKHLRGRVWKLLSKANEMVEVNTHEDPHYRIADSKLG